MEGVRRSPRLKLEPGNTAPQNAALQDAALQDAAPQDSASQSEGKSAATKGKKGLKRKADSPLQVPGNSGTDARDPKIQLLNSGKSLRVPSIVENDFQEDAPMTGASPDPPANFFDEQGTNSIHEHAYFVDESHFDSAVTSVESMTETHTAVGWDTNIRLKGRSTYRLKKYYGIYWLDKSKVKRIMCQKRFEDKAGKLTENWILKGVKAVAIEYKSELWKHRFDMDYFFDRSNWKKNKNGAPLMPWAMQVELVWYDTVTAETETTWEVPSTVWKLFGSRERAEEAMLKTAKKRAEMSSEIEERNAGKDDAERERWETPAPDTWNKTQAGTGIETTSTAISDATQSPAIELESPRSKRPLRFTRENSSQHPSSAQQQPRYGEAQSYPTPPPDLSDIAR